MAAVVVPWHEYSGQDAEGLIAGLIVRTVPCAQRIDGSGGDDGVDVRVPAGQGRCLVSEVTGRGRARSPEREAGRAREPVHGPPWGLRQTPRTVRKLFVYCSAV